MLLPPAKTEQRLQTSLRDVIFVLDTSGYVLGDSIKQAKQALLLAIE
jgi:hypothetical protein